MLRGGEAIQPEQEGKGKVIWGGGEDEFKGDKDRRQGAPRDRGEMRQVRHSSKDK